MFSYINYILNVVKWSLCEHVIVCLTGPRWSLVAHLLLCLSRPFKGCIVSLPVYEGLDLGITTPPHPHPCDPQLHILFHFKAHVFLLISLSSTTKLKHRQTDRLLLCCFLSKCCLTLQSNCPVAADNNLF